MISRPRITASKQKAPVAKFDSTSAFSLLDETHNGHAFAKRSSYMLMNKEFSSEMYLPLDDAGSVTKRPESEMEPNASTVSLIHMNPDEDDVIAKKQLLSYANSMISFDRCHSLEFKPLMDRQDSFKVF